MRHLTLCCAGKREKYRNVDVTAEVHKAMHYYVAIEALEKHAGRSNLPAVFRFVMRRVRLL